MHYSHKPIDCMKYFVQIETAIILPAITLIICFDRAASAVRSAFFRVI